jgi:hypothetical protein
LGVQVPAVGGGVLSDETDLPHALGGHLFGLLLDDLQLSAAEFPTDDGDGTVGAAVVAAVGDLQIGAVPQGQLAPGDGFLHQAVGIVQHIGP